MATSSSGFRSSALRKASVASSVRPSVASASPSSCQASASVRPQLGDPAQLVDRVVGAELEARQAGDPQQVGIVRGRGERRVGGLAGAGEVAGLELGTRVARRLPGSRPSPWTLRDHAAFCPMNRLRVNLDLAQAHQPLAPSRCPRACGRTGRHGAMHLDGQVLEEAPAARSRGGSSLPRAARYGRPVRTTWIPPCTDESRRTRPSRATPVDHRARVRCGVTGRMREPAAEWSLEAALAAPRRSTRRRSGLRAEEDVGAQVGCPQPALRRLWWPG